MLVNLIFFGSFSVLFIFLFYSVAYFFFRWAYDQLIITRCDKIYIFNILKFESHAFEKEF